jgi:sodium transport system ATP-binding protein
MERDAADARAQDLARMFDMTALLDRRTEGFSQGERHEDRAGAGAGARPANIVLDEPTNGLDVLATRALRESLRWLRTPAGGGKCIVFSTTSCRRSSASATASSWSPRDAPSRAAGRRAARAHGQSDFEEAFVRLAFRRSLLPRGGHEAQHRRRPHGCSARS